MRNTTKEEVVKQLHPLPKTMSESEIQAVLDKTSRQILVNEKVAEVLHDLLFVFDNQREVIIQIVDDLFMYTLISNDAEDFDREKRENYFLVYSRFQRLLRAVEVIKTNA